MVEVIPTTSDESEGYILFYINLSENLAALKYTKDFKNKFKSHQQYTTFMSKTLKKWLTEDTQAGNLGSEIYLKEKIIKHLKDYYKIECRTLRLEKLVTAPKQRVSNRSSLKFHGDLQDKMGINVLSEEKLLANIFSSFFVQYEHHFYLNSSELMELFLIEDYEDMEFHRVFSKEHILLYPYEEDSDILKCSLLIPSYFKGTCPDEIKKRGNYKISNDGLKSCFEFYQKLVKEPPGWTKHILKPGELETLGELIGNYDSFRKKFVTSFSYFSQNFEKSYDKYLDDFISPDWPYSL